MAVKHTPARARYRRRRLHFERLTPTQFEEFVRDLLDELALVNIDWRKGTGKKTSPSDSGRDIVCQQQRTDVDDSVHLETWFVDCKHSTRGVPPTELQNLLAWAQAERPDIALVVVSNFLSNAALALNLADPEARVFCPGHAAFYGRDFRCHKRGGHGWVDLRAAIKVSCDIYFYNLGRRLGVDRISEIATAFGFGRPTGVDIAFEKSGLVPSEEWARTKRGARWYPSETISVSIGQGPVLVTPMQVARAMAGLLESGRLPTPHLFFSSQAPGTGAPLRYKAEFREGWKISAEHQRIVRDALWAVVNEPGGTAYGSRVEGIAMGGKTGTVQVVGREAIVRAGADRAKLQDHAWFVGFGPVEDPKMVVVVFIEHGGHGNLAAAPLAKLLFEARFVAPPPAAPGVQASAPPPPPGIRPAAHRETR